MVYYFTNIHMCGYEIKEKIIKFNRAKNRNFLKNWNILILMSSTQVGTYCSNSQRGFKFLWKTFNSWFIVKYILKYNLFRTLKKYKIFLSLKTEFKLWNVNKSFFIAFFDASLRKYTKSLNININSKWWWIRSTNTITGIPRI